MHISLAPPSWHLLIIWSQNEVGILHEQKSRHKNLVKLSKMFKFMCKYASVRHIYIQGVPKKSLQQLFSWRDAIFIKNFSELKIHMKIIPKSKFCSTLFYHFRRRKKTQKIRDHSRHKNFGVVHFYSSFYFWILWPAQNRLKIPVTCSTFFIDDPNLKFFKNLPQNQRIWKSQFSSKFQNQKWPGTRDIQLAPKSVESLAP